MRHLKKGRKLNRTSSHKKALLGSLATSLFEHKKIVTTEAKAKELRPYAEKIITRAKNALIRETNGMLPEGQEVDVQARREVYRKIRNKAVLQELFDAIAPAVEERAGGYTRIVKLGRRRGDGAKTAVIELVDWSAPQDGQISIKPKKKKKAEEPKHKEPEIETFDDVEEIEETPEVSEEAKVEEAPAEEKPAEEAKVEEAPAEEKPAEEAKVDEAPTDEKKEDEKEDKKDN